MQNISMLPSSLLLITINSVSLKMPFVGNEILCIFGVFQLIGNWRTKLDFIRCEKIKVSFENKNVTHSNRSSFKASTGSSFTPRLSDPTCLLVV